MHAYHAIKEKSSHKLRSRVKIKVFIGPDQTLLPLANHYLEYPSVNCTVLPFYTGVLHILHSCYTFCTPFSANQNGVFSSCIFLTIKRVMPNRAVLVTQ